jgi:hypothetical protein
MHPLSPQVISYADFIRASRAEGWAVSAGERIGFYGEALQNSTFPTEKAGEFHFLSTSSFFFK